MYKSSYDNSKIFLEFKMRLKWLKKETLENSPRPPQHEQIQTKSYWLICVVFPSWNPSNLSNSDAPRTERLDNF